LALNKDIWRANFYRFCQLLEQENPDAPKLGTTSHPGDDPFDSALAWYGFPGQYPESGGD
jgi:predicted component of type VI protein secretion system